MGDEAVKFMDATVCIGIGIVLGICIGHAQAKDDFSSCWRAMSDRPLAERINQCVPALNEEWRKTRKGWKQ